MSRSNIHEPSEYSRTDPSTTQTDQPRVWSATIDLISRRLSPLPGEPKSANQRVCHCWERTYSCAEWPCLQHILTCRARVVPSHTIPSNSRQLRTSVEGDLSQRQP